MTATAAPPKTYTFVARGHNQVITLDPARLPQLDPLNRLVVAASDGEHVRFVNNFAHISAETIADACDACKSSGTLIRDGEMVDCGVCGGVGTIEREITRCNGERINLRIDQVLAALRAEPTFNLSVPGGFWEEGAAPDEPQPTMADQMKAVAAASVFSDLEKLAEIRELEESTHKRVAVLQAIEIAERAVALKDQDTDPEAEAGGSGEPDASGSISPEPTEPGEEPAS